MKKTTMIALITARGGSKGLKRKNICPLGGKPLIAWTIEAALKARGVDRVLVSTEDEEIALVSLRYGAEVISRPYVLATDNASSISVIDHAIDWCENEGLLFEHVLLLQPTSPLRKTKDIEEAIKFYMAKKADAVISVFEPRHTPIKAYIELEDGQIQGLFSDEAPYQRRQDLPKAFQPNGAIYIFSKDVFKREGCIPKTNLYPYVMSEERSLDIDTEKDLIEAEHFLMESKNE